MPTYDGLSHSLNAILGPGASTLLNGQTDSLNAYLIYPSGTGTDYSTSYAYRDAMDEALTLSLCLDLIRDNEYIPIYKENFTFQVKRKVININITESLSKVYDGLPLMPRIDLTNYDEAMDKEVISIVMSQHIDEDNNESNENDNDTTSEVFKPYLIDVGEKEIDIDITNNDSKNYSLSIKDQDNESYDNPVTLTVTAANPGPTSLLVEGPYYINTEYPVMFSFSEDFPIDSSTYVYNDGTSDISCKVLSLGKKQDTSGDEDLYGILYTEDDKKNRSYINVSSARTINNKTIQLTITNNNYNFALDGETPTSSRTVPFVMSFVKPTIYIDYDTSLLTSVYNAKKLPHEIYDFNFMYYTEHWTTTENDVVKHHYNGLIQPDILPVIGYRYNGTVRTAKQLMPFKSGSPYVLTIIATDNANYHYEIPQSQEKKVLITPYVVTDANFTGDITQYDYYHYYDDEDENSSWKLGYDVDAAKAKLVDSDNKDVIKIEIQKDEEDQEDQPDYYAEVKEIGREGYTKTITLVFSFVENISSIYAQPITGTISTSYILQKLSARVIINNSVSLTEAQSAPFAHVQYVLSDSTSLPITDNDRWNQVWEDFVLEASDLPNPLVPGNYGNHVTVNLKPRTDGNTPTIDKLYDIHFDTTHALDVVKKTYSSHTITYTKYPVHDLRLDDVLTVTGIDDGVQTALTIVSSPTLKYGISEYILRAVDPNGIYEPINDTIRNVSVAPFYSIEIKLAEGRTPVVNAEVMQADFTYTVTSKEPSNAADVTFTLTYHGPETYQAEANIITATATSGGMPLTMNVTALNVQLSGGGEDGDDGSGETIPTTT